MEFTPRQMSALAGHANVARCLDYPVFVDDKHQVSITIERFPNNHETLFSFLARRADQGPFAVCSLNTTGLIAQPRATETMLAASERAISHWLKMVGQHYHPDFAKMKTRQRRLLEIRATISRGGRAPHSFWLPSDEERECRSLIESMFGKSSSLGALSRFIYWSNGSRGLIRFHEALPVAARMMLESFDSTTAFIRLLKNVLPAALRCDGTDPHWTTIREAVDKLHPDLLRTPKLWWETGDLELADYCSVMLKRLQTRMAEGAPLRRVAAALAMLCAYDDSDVPIPSDFSFFLRNNCDKDLSKVIKLILARKGQPAYSLVLEMFTGTDWSPEELRAALELADGGIDVGDIYWAKETGMLGWFAANKASVAWCKELFTSASKHGIHLSTSDLSHLLPSCGDPSGWSDAVLRFPKWLSRMDAKVLTLDKKRIRRTLTHTLYDAYHTLNLSREIDGWLNPKPHKRRTNPLNEVLADIRFYQQWSGRGSTLPNSVERLIGKNRKVRRERSFLQSEVAAGRATKSQKQRLEHISRPSMTAHSADTLIRKCKELRFKTALRALDDRINRELEQTWYRRTGFELPDELREKREDVTSWLLLMNTDQLALLTRTLTAWRDHGEKFKRQLPGNAKWLRRAKKNGVRRNRWLFPTEETMRIARRDYKVSVIRNPYEVFMMGTRFGTCLSLGHVNQMSVLANAYDANKNVIYVHDEKGRPTARMLIALNRQFQLIKYHCYLQHPNSSEDLQDQFDLAIGAYAARLAKRCGVQLSEDGEPEILCKSFWYDDGTVEWHDSDKQAWLTEPSSYPSA